ncbi:GNAT family N-acetyltransferase [Desemzia sp. FAM 23991]|uniref:GNAT family N-acetyltransferase n=1 Tax=unclassified Desemzia TaxID=2685243 RepID=UPI003888075E
MNILLTSVGRRSYLVNYFKEVLGRDGKVHVSNSSSDTPAFKSADYSIVSPLIYDNEYIPFLLKYCKENNIGAIISLFDIDLPILSKNKKLFQKNGIQLVISDEKVIEVCNDKLKTFQFLTNHEVKSPLTFTSLAEAKTEIENDNLQFPVIIKPRWGMGSIGVYEVDNEEELNTLYNKTLKSIERSYLKYESDKNLKESIVIQEKLKGQEYGLDIINDLEGRYHTTIVKKKYAMRAGETDAAVTVDNKKLKLLGKKISETFKHIGNLDVDVFLVDDIPYVLEINARFGGGYPFSHIAGVNLPKAIIKWLKNEKISEDLLEEKIGVLSHKDINITVLESYSDEHNEVNIKKITRKDDLTRLLENYDTVFRPSLSSRKDNLEEYSNKLLSKAQTFVIENEKTELGFITFYANDFEKNIAYIVFLGVSSSCQGKKLGQKLLNQCLNTVFELGMKEVRLEVRVDNIKALNFYQKNNFYITEKASEISYYMTKKLDKGEKE